MPEYEKRTLSRPLFSISIYNRQAGARQKEGPAATYSPTANRSTIGVRVLNFRVREGNGCVHPAVATGPANAWEREDPRTTGLGSPGTGRMIWSSLSDD